MTGGDLKIDVAVDVVPLKEHLDTISRKIAEQNARSEAIAIANYALRLEDYARALEVLIRVHGREGFDAEGHITHYRESFIGDHPLRWYRTPDANPPPEMFRGWIEDGAWRGEDTDDTRDE